MLLFMTNTANLLSNTKMNCDSNIVNTQYFDITSIPLDGSISPEGSSRSVYSEQFSMEDLLHRVTTFKRIEELKTVERLTEENQLLRERITFYQRIWQGAIDLLDEAIETAVSMQKILEDYDHGKATAERDWLAFWGIFRESIAHCGPQINHWI